MNERMKWGYPEQKKLKDYMREFLTKKKSF